MADERSVHPAAASYDLRVGPFALGFARSLLEAVAHVGEWRATVEVLDHGAGTGLSSRLIRHHLPAARVTALEPSAELASGLPAEPWCTTVLGTVEHLSAVGQFDAVVSNLVLMFCPDPLDTMRRLRRTVGDGGVLAASVLGRADEVQPFHAYWTAVRSVRGDAWSPERYPHHRLAGTVGQLAAAAGWKVVEERTAVIRQVIDPVDAWDWLHGALPVGLGDSYGQLDAGEIDRVQESFLHAAPCEFVSHGTLLIATAGCS
jgi:trans-aconitate methyltransferase